MHVCHRVLSVLGVTVTQSPNGGKLVVVWVSCTPRNDNASNMHYAIAHCKRGNIQRSVVSFGKSTELKKTGVSVIKTAQHYHL